MRVLVTGGRNYRNRQQVFEALDAVHAETPIRILIHGAADGADMLADEWAIRRGVTPDRHPAQWDDLTHPKRRLKWCSKRRAFYDALAGFRRNGDMLHLGEPDLVVAFPGGNGTADMIAKAERKRVAVRKVCG